MPAKTPLMSKTPFAIDPKPMQGQSSARAGVSAVSRVFRSLKLPGACQANLNTLKVRNAGWDSAQVVESLIILHAAGGDTMDDIDMLREDEGLWRMLGYELPASRSVRDFLLRFHSDEVVRKAEKAARRQKLLAFIPEETSGLEGLRRVLTASARSAAKALGNWQIATVDEDTTIIESHKKSAKWTHEGIKGYQPVVATWAETGLVVADEFRDGNVPAKMAPVECAKAAFAALPDSVTRRHFRGDSGCYEWNLLKWLRHEDRSKEAGGAIGFAISASRELAG